MISQFSIRNFKALRDVTLQLTPLHVLIGPNDSGKTSILEALAAVCRSVDMMLTDAFSGRWNGFDLVWQGNRDLNVESEIIVDGAQHPLHYELSVGFGSSRREVLLARQEFRSDGVESKTTASLVRDALSGVQLYRWQPQFLSLPNAPDAKRRFRMEPSGFGLALCLDDIIGYDRKLFDALEKRFTTIFPEIEVIRLLPEPAFLAPTDYAAAVPELKKSDGKGIYFQLANDGPLIPASQASDGTLLILAYLTILHLPKPPRVLLIEEPENGIHPGRLKDVLSILRELIQHQQQTQVLMTTHSPYVVDMFKPEEVTLCFKGNDGAVQTRRLSDSQAVREQIDVFTLGEIWTGDGDERLMEPALAEGADA